MPQREEDPDTYSNFFWMRRGEGTHVYCVLVRSSGVPSYYMRAISHLRASSLLCSRHARASMKHKQNSVVNMVAVARRWSPR